MADTVLIVDDSVDSRRLLRRVVELAGLEVIEAADGQTAIDICRQTLPELVLLDVEMEGMDGYEVCTALRSDPTTSEMPIVFLSARTSSADKVTGLEVGAQDYITKPFDRGEVVARVRTQLRIYHLNRSLREANRQLEARQKELDLDLVAAAAIQRSLLPIAAHDNRRYDIQWRFRPSDHVGGDLLSVNELDQDYLGISVMDVSGHGVPSAMVAVAVSQLLLPERGITATRTSTTFGLQRIARPAEVLEALDREFPLERFRKFFTMVYLVLHQESGRIKYANAGHPRPLLHRATGELEILDLGGPFVGLGGIMPFVEGELTLEPGDRLFLFTDGILEHADSSGDYFGEERLTAALCGSRRTELKELCDTAIEAVFAHGGADAPEDDIALLAVERLRP